MIVAGRDIHKYYLVAVHTALCSIFPRCSVHPQSIHRPTPATASYPAYNGHVASSHHGGATEGATDAHSLIRVRTFRERTVHCLVLAHFTTGGPYILETMLIHCTSEILLCKHAETGLWMHQRANKGFELLNSIAYTDNNGILLRIWCISAAESDVLACAGLAGKLTVASDSTNRHRSDIIFRYDNFDDGQMYLRLRQELHDNCCFSRRRPRRRGNSAAGAVAPDAGFASVGARFIVFLHPSSVKDQDRLL